MYLCCGDALYDLFVGDSTLSASALSLEGDVGGSPINVATGLARLGQSSGYFTKLSTDLFGERMRSKLISEGLALETSIATERNTTLAVIEKNPDGSARYVFYTEGTADTSLTTQELPDELPESVRVLHFGSFSTAASPSGLALQSLAQREAAKGCFISYDPNIRLPVVPDIAIWRERFEGFSRTASFIKASDEDIEALYGANKEDNFVADCLARGAGVVCITRGAEGASAFSADGRSAHSRGVKVDVEDTVGAGDTFQSTCLYWLGTEGHVGKDGSVVGTVDLDAMTALALRAAAITCTRKGADLPRLADLGLG